jgi:O-antigen ligase
MTTASPAWRQLQRMGASNRQRVRVALACALPAAAAASGFTPLHHAVDELNVDQRPLFVLLTPTVLLAAAAVVVAIVYPRRPLPSIVKPLSVAAALLLLGAALSITASAEPTDSLVLLIGGLAAPLVFMLALLCSDLPGTTLCWSLLLVTAAFLLRADVVFLTQEGLPTPDTLFQVKFSNAPYDFHYYTLNNPNYSSAFLIVPFTLATLWAIDEELARTSRLLLTALAGLMLVNIVLVYGRVTMIMSGAIVVFALFVSALSRRLKVLITGGLIAVALPFVLSSSSLDYFGKLFESDDDASGAERVGSVADGMDAFANHPLAGVGFGRYGASEGLAPAHSSIAQAAAETGIAGLLGALVFTLVLVVNAWRIGGARNWRGIAAAAAAAAGAFVLQMAIVAGPPTLLATYAHAVFGLSVGIVLTASFAAPRIGPTWRSPGTAQIPPKGHC